MNGALILNALIFSTTLVLVFNFFREGGRWNLGRGIRLFRFFTVQSNAFCGAACLLMCFLPDQPWAWTLKYVGTAAVTVTMMTVLVFLAPAVGSLRKLIRGNDFFMHLVTPLAAIFCFSVFEKHRDMTFGTALLGMLPVVLYGTLYLYKIKYAPQEKRWDDFYGFNHKNRWKVSYVAMMIGGFAVCMGLMGLQHI